MKAKIDYFMLLFDSDRDDLQTVENYEMGGFDLRRLWTGEIIDGEIPSCVKIFVNNGLTSDCLGNPLSWLFVSKQMADLLQPFVFSYVQFLPITLYSATGAPVRDYLLANPLGAVDAIVPKKRKKENVSIFDMILDSDKIPADRHVFRLLHQPTCIILSQDVVNALKNKGLKGIAAKKIPMK